MKENGLEPQLKKDKTLSGLTIAIGIATCGRPQILLDVLADLQRQTKAPLVTIVAYVDPKDIDDGVERFPHIRFIRSDRGSCKQRNTIIEAAYDCDLVLFLDDDFYIHPEYLASIEAVFSDDHKIVAITGNVLADGINSPGLKPKEAKEVLKSVKTNRIAQSIVEVFNTYGCNMSFRMKTIMENRIRFDERLPLYGWFEDVEFSRQLAAYGKIVKVSNAYGVHLGAKSGRTSGVKLGYSQVANPFYLAQKGTLTWPDAFQRVATRFLKNLIRSLVPEPYLDRRGRLQGNLRALKDFTHGMLDPGRILDF